MLFHYGTCTCICTLYIICSVFFQLSVFLVVGDVWLSSYFCAGGVIKVNVAVYKDLNIEFVSKESFCHENAG